MPRRPVRRVALVLALVVAMSGAQGALPIEDDAGSGGDAPDVPEKAVTLPGQGNYTGNLTTPTDADWYRLDEAQDGPSCIRARVSGLAVADVVLSDDPHLATSVERAVHPEDTVALGLATDQPESLVLGLEPRERDGQAVAAGLGTYDFNVTYERASNANGDPVNGGDAPAPGADQVPDAPSSCFTGTLTKDPGLAAAGDAYGFHGHLGEKVTLTLTTASDDDPTTYVNLTDPAGNVVASVTDDEPRTVTLDKSGRWSVGVETTEKVTELRYGVGLVDDPGDDDDDDEDNDGPSCRPSCAPYIPLP